MTSTAREMPHYTCTTCGRQVVRSAYRATCPDCGGRLRSGSGD